MGAGRRATSAGLGDGLMSGGWRIVGASEQGSSHQKTGRPCQDSLEWEITPDGVLIVAAADGAGSAEFSQDGSMIAATSAVRFLNQSLCLDGPSDEAFWKELLTSALQLARAQVEQFAQDRGVQLRELASTLILVAATDQSISAIQVGDGAIVIDDDDDRLIALTKPQNGEFINETTFLVSAEYLETAQFAFRRRRVARLAVLTDGLQALALKLPGSEPHAPFFTPLFRFARTAGEDASELLSAFLRSPKMTERADDDLTLLLAVR